MEFYSWTAGSYSFVDGIPNRRLVEFPLLEDSIEGTKEVQSIKRTKIEIEISVFKIVTHRPTVGRIEHPWYLNIINIH